MPRTAMVCTLRTNCFVVNTNRTLFDERFRLAGRPTSKRANRPRPFVTQYISKSALPETWHGFPVLPKPLREGRDLLRAIDRAEEGIEPFYYSVETGDPTAIVRVDNEITGPARIRDAPD